MSVNSYSVCKTVHSLTISTHLGHTSDLEVIQNTINVETSISYQGRKAVLTQNYLKSRDSIRNNKDM